MKHPPPPIICLQEKIFKRRALGSQIVFNTISLSLVTNDKLKVYDDIVNTGAVQLQPGQPFFWNENEHYTGENPNEYYTGENQIEHYTYEN